MAPWPPTSPPLPAAVRGDPGGSARAGRARPGPAALPGGGPDRPAADRRRLRPAPARRPAGRGRGRLSSTTATGRPASPRSATPHGSSTCRSARRPRCTSRPPTPTRTAPLGVDPPPPQAVVRVVRVRRRAPGASVAAGAAPDDDPTEAQLWPEHFDLALSIGPDGGRANVGASPGDADHDAPYLYVGPWEPRPGGRLERAVGSVARLRGDPRGRGPAGVRRRWPCGPCAPDPLRPSEPASDRGRPPPWRWWNRAASRWTAATRATGPRAAHRDPGRRRVRPLGRTGPSPATTSWSAGSPTWPSGVSSTWPTSSPAQIINLAREACAAPIETELLLPADEVLTDPVGGPTGRRKPSSTERPDPLLEVRPSARPPGPRRGRPRRTASSILAVAASTSAFDDACRRRRPRPRRCRPALSPAASRVAQLVLGEPERLRPPSERSARPKPCPWPPGPSPPGKPPVVGEAVLHEVGDPLLEVRLRVGRRLVDGLLAGGHERVDQRGPRRRLRPRRSRPACRRRRAGCGSSSSVSPSASAATERSKAPKKPPGPLPGCSRVPALGVRRGGRGRRRAGVDWAPLVVGVPSMAPKAAPPVRVAANATAAAARLVVRCIELS